MADTDPKQSGPADRFLLPSSALFHFKSIDHEHQALFDLLNAAAAEFRESAAITGASFAAHIARLREQMAIYFENEEQEMALAGYGGTQGHAAHHGAVLARLDSFHADTLACATVAVEATFELLDRLLDDVLRADLPFKDFLAARGLLPTR